MGVADNVLLQFLEHRSAVVVVEACMACKALVVAWVEVALPHYLLLAANHLVLGDEDNSIQHQLAPEEEDPQ